MEMGLDPLGSDLSVTVKEDRVRDTFVPADDERLLRDGQVRGTQAGTTDLATVKRQSGVSFCRCAALVCAVDAGHVVAALRAPAVGLQRTHGPAFTWGVWYNEPGLRDVATHTAHSMQPATHDDMNAPNPYCTSILRGC